MKRVYRLLFLVSTITFLNGCASVVTGTSQTLTFNSEPDEATVIVAGKTIGKTPVSVSIDKGKKQSLTFEKEGYKSQTMQLTTTVTGWFWGNIICCGLLGSTTDSASGAMNEFAPDQYFVTLSPKNSFDIATSKSRKIKEMVVAFGSDMRAELASGGGDKTQVILHLVGINVGDNEYDINVEVLRQLANKNENDLDLSKKIIEFYEVD